MKSLKSAALGVLAGAFVIELIITAAVRAEQSSQIALPQLKVYRIERTAPDAIRLKPQNTPAVSTLTLLR